MHKSSILATVGVLTIFVLTLLGTPLARADMYYNSAEPGCDGSDANVLFCDDFEDGDWYATDCDTSGGAGNPANDGWCGTIYANPTTPTNAAVCGNEGVVGSNCAATSGYQQGLAPGGKNMAQHYFENDAEYDNIYFRLYFQPQNDYNGGHEKMFDIMTDSNPGWMVTLCYNYFGSETIACIPYLHQDDGVQGQAQAWMDDNIATAPSLERNHWYAFQMRAALNTPGQYDGIFEWWLDDCGTDGQNCTANPTLRGRYTNVMFRDASQSTIRLGGIWIENWANAPTTGTMYYDNVRVAVTGPIPFANTGVLPTDTTPPTATITAPTASQVLVAGTTSTTLSVTTNESATCRWSATDVAYASMANTMTGSGTTSHSATLTGLTNGGSNTTYVRCSDTAGNAMTSSQNRSFSVATPQYPNRPVDFTTVLVDYGFDDAIPTAGAPYYDTGEFVYGWGAVNPGGMVRDTNQDGPQSPPNAIRWDYTTACCSGTGVGRLYRTRDFSPRPDKLYVSFWMKHDANFEWNTISNKLLYLYGDGDLMLQSRYNNEYLSLYWNSGNPLVWSPTNNQIIPLGQWVQVEYLIDSTNGRVQLWMDGTQTLDRTIPNLEGNFNIFTIDSTWGGGGTKTRNSQRWMDHIFVATTSTETDTTPPVATITTPTASQVLAAGTTSTTLSVTTNESATCRWSTTDVAYASMTNTMTGSGTTSHSATLTGLANGQSYTRYVRCQDTVQNNMTTSASASFSVASPTTNTMYFNSAEPGCDGSDPNVLLCDDFEDGVWYATNCDTSGGPNNPENDGWCGTIYANPITPANAAVCDGAGYGGSTCAATHGVSSGAIGGRNMASHNLAQPVDEFYARYYIRVKPGYLFGGEKVLTLNKYDGGGIYFGNVHFNVGAGDSTPTGALQFQPTGSETNNKNTGFSLTGNDHWYFIEIHGRLSSSNGAPDGTLRIWADDCGIDGSSCTGTPTLRYNQTNYRWVRLPGDLFGNLWFENWANPPSTGERHIDNIKVSRVGPIGFVGTTTPTRRIGDLNGDGVVNILDVSLIIQNFKRRMNYDEGADINNDGTVNILDMVLLGRNWGDGGTVVFNPLGNRPAGYTNVETDYGFSAAIPASYGDSSFGDGSGWYTVFNSAGKTYRATDASASISPSYVLESEYTVGQGTPTASAGFGKIFRRPGPGKSAWYISFSIWHDENFEFNRVSNKMLAIWPRGLGSQILESRHFSGDFLAWQFEDVAGVPYYRENTAFGSSLTDSFFRGNWVNVEVEYKPGVTDGEIRVWAGRSDGSDGARGQLVSEYTGIYVPEINSANEISLDTTWGGGNGPTTRTSYRRIDHIYIAHP